MAARTVVKSRLFSDADFKRIEAAIAEAERRTAGELVVLVAPASDDYRGVTWRWLFVGIVLGSGAVGFVSASAHWPLSFWRILEWQAVGGALGALLSYLPPVRRLSIPRKTAAHRVHRECLANFTAVGLHETRDRTGVLVYLSELEHRVEILADRGIHAKLGESYWAEQVSAVVRGIVEKRAAEAVVETIGRIGNALAEHFPPRPDDRNELGDQVLRGPQGS